MNIEKFRQIALMEAEKAGATGSKKFPIETDGPDIIKPSAQVYATVLKENGVRNVWFDAGSPGVNFNTSYDGRSVTHGNKLNIGETS